MRTSTAPHAAPKPIASGAAALGVGVERYVVKAGGSAVFALDGGDRLELVLVHGGQSVELAAFGKNGASALGALGLKARGQAAGLQRILASGSEDAERVRFGLFRRHLDIGRAKAAKLFGSDAAPGQTITLEADRAVVAVVAVPAEPMLVWDQTPPSDVLAFVTRAHPLPAGQPRLPEPLANPRLDITIGIATAESFEVAEGEYIQIIDLAGRQCSDFLAFQRRALDKGAVLGLDATTTRTMTGLACPAPGLHAKFFDRDRTPLVEIVQDTVGRHDTFNLACTARYYEDMGYFGHANCSDNFNGALRDYAIGDYRGWPAINFFFNTHVDAQNVIWFDEPWSRPGDYVLMRALTDLVCAASACPCDIDPANGWRLSEIQLRVYSKEALFKRAIGYRMTPEAPLQLTRETGFHPRTSRLTRAFGEYRGFWMPQHFAASGAIGEYWACRERVVIMDLSPLRKLEILGPDAESFAQSLFPRDIRKLAVGQVVYTPLCYDHGGMADDGTLFRMGENNFRWVGGDDTGLVWIKEQAARSGANVLLKSASDQIHNIAVQGPKSRDTLRQLLWTPPGRPAIDELGWFRFTVGRFGGYDGIPVLISRTGYTGELGYEVFCHPQYALAVWDAIMAAGAVYGIAPLGFEALDMVRIEAGLVFGGFDFDSTIDPFEAGIGFTVAAKKQEDYVGRDALLRRRASPARTFVGLDIEGSEKAVHGDRVYRGRAEIGIVTSGTRSPALKKTIALARLDAAYGAIGTKVEIGKLDGMQKRLAATVVSLPFYDPAKDRVRS